MSKKRKQDKPFEFNVNISPAKRRKKHVPKVGCILQCTRKNDGTDTVTKFSEASRKRVYEAARKRNDEEVIALLDSFGEDLPPPEYGYHRKCYQKYSHGKLKTTQKAKPNRERMSSRKKVRAGMTQ